jgi:hypothetical protein
MIRIIIREILMLLAAILIVMAFGLVADNGQGIQFQNIKKFEINIAD